MTCWKRRQYAGHGMLKVPSCVGHHTLEELAFVLDIVRWTHRHCWTSCVGRAGMLLQIVCWARRHYAGRADIMLDMGCWTCRYYVGLEMLDAPTLCWTWDVGRADIVLDMECWTRPHYVGHGVLDAPTLCWKGGGPTPKPDVARATSGSGGVECAPSRHLVLEGCVCTPPEPAGFFILHHTSSVV